MILPLKGVLFVSALVATATQAWSQPVPTKWVDLPMEIPPGVFHSIPIGAKAPSDVIHISVCMPYRDPVGMQKFVDSVSDPKSPNYRHFISPDEVGRRFGIPSVGVKKVTDYLISQGMTITFACKNRLSIQAEATVKQVQTAFDIQLELFAPIESGKMSRDIRYSFTSPPKVPASIKPYVSYIGCLECYTHATALSPLTPDQLRTLYGVSPAYNRGDTGAGRTIGISNYGGYRLTNVPLFYSKFGLPVPPEGVIQHIRQVSIDGKDGNTYVTITKEGDLDIQCLAGMAPLAKIIIYDDASTVNDPIAVLSREVSDNDADIISESWVWDRDVPLNLACHNLHLSMSAQGITYIGGAGDRGTSDVVNKPYPDMDPEVLIVGGTKVTTGVSGNRISETTWNDTFGAGGGGWVESDDTYNSLPSYQKGLGVPTGINHRLVPDVAFAASGDPGYAIFFAGVETGDGGTSAATPTLAGALADCEQQIIDAGGLGADANGKHRFGRIQDLLYSFNGDPSVFYDIKDGSTNGQLPDGTPSLATVGWDTATGWGPIIFSGFTTRVLNSTALLRFSVSPVWVLNGNSAIGTVTLTSPAPVGGVSINLASSNPDVAQVPATITLAEGTITNSFVITTSARIAIPVNVTITASRNGIAYNQSLGVGNFNHQSRAPWPKFHRDPVNSGDAIGGGSNGLLKWSAFTENSGYSSPSIGNDGTVYVGLNGSELFAFFKDGSVKWSLGLAYEIANSPAIDEDGTVYVATMWGGLNAIKPDGTLKWNCPIGSTIADSSPAIGQDGTIYVGSGDFYIYAVNPDGSVKWRYKTGGAVQSSPAIGWDGTIYIGSDDQYLYAIWPNGTLRWRFYGGEAVQCSPAIGSDGCIFVGSYDCNLYAVNPNGTERWRFATGAYIASSPAIAPDGTIYVGSNDHVLYAINPDGTKRWGFATGGQVVSSPAIDAFGTIYVGSTDTNFYAVNPDGTLKWSFPTGYTQISPAIGDDGTIYTSSYTLTTNGYPFFAIGTQVFDIPISSVTVSPSSIPGGYVSTGTVTLSQKAPNGGDIVTLKSSDPSVVVPGFVSVQGGATTATFTISTSPVLANTNATITATSGGQSTTAVLTVQAWGVAGITVSPTTIVGGNSPTSNTVTLSVGAPSGGAIVKLSSSRAEAFVPATVTVAAGATTANFAITTGGVDASTAVTITATYGATVKTCTLTLLPAWPLSVTVSPTTVVGGATTVVTGKVNLIGRAGPSGTVVTLTSSNTSAATVPTSVTVPANALNTTFSVMTLAVSSNQAVTITATALGKSSTTTLNVNAAALSSVTISTASIVGGNNPTGGTVTLSGPAPTGGAVVNLSSGSTAVTVPSSVTVAAGATTATFAVLTSGVDTSTTVTVTASFNSVNKTCTLTVLPAWINTVVVAPTSVVGGGTLAVTGTANLIGQAGPSGTVVTLTSSNTSAVTVPATVTVSAGTIKSTFVVTTKTVTSAQTVTITATAQGHSATATLTVNPSNLASFTITSTTLVGGNSPNATITLVNAAPAGGTVVNVSASSPSVKVPATVTVPTGATNVMFAVPTAGVDANLTATLTANLGGATKSCTLTLLPAWILSVTASPTTIAGGNPITASANLIGQAGPSGTVVSLTSSNTSAATVPATVTVVGGALKIPFTITTLSVATTQTVTITGTALGKSATLTITVTAADLASITTAPTSLVGGNYPNGTVTLTAPAPTGGTVVNLSSNNSKATVPASVTVVAGSKTATFAIPTFGVDTTTPVTLTAALGSTTKTCTLTLQPAWPMTLTVTPSTVVGGSATTVSGKVALNGRAGPSGTVVTLTSSDPTVASVPASVTDGANGLNTTITTITITATANGKSVTTTLTVTP